MVLAQAAAAGAIAGGHQLIGSALFCLALNHKQMSLYWAPAFFAHLLGWALQQKDTARKVLIACTLLLSVVPKSVVTRNTDNTRFDIIYAP